MGFTDLLVPMLIFLLIGIIGITFWLAWVIFKARYKKQLQIADAAAPPSLTEALRAASLLTLNRAPSGEWAIAVNGQRYPSLEAVPDDAVRQEVVAGLKELVAFARGYVQKEQIVQTQPAPEVQPEPVRPATPLTLALQMPSVAKPAAPPASASPTDKFRVFLKGEPALKRSGTLPTIMPTLDLAREISEIVSEMQASIPSLAQRSIRLQNAPSGGIHFAIDGIVYPDVNEIPDVDIQALIRAATKEWERR